MTEQHTTIETPRVHDGSTPWRGEIVIDCHLHERPDGRSLIDHLDGAGVTSALVLAIGDFQEDFARLTMSAPGRVAGWARGPYLSDLPALADDPDRDAFDMTKVISVRSRQAIRSVLTAQQRRGWRGFAETTGAVAVDGPELQRVYALAAELDVPVMMHFQEAAVPGQPDYGIKGFSRIASMLSKYPETRFICHAPDFWGGIDARYTDGGTYLTGPVPAGGLSDRLLGDYPNMYGDLGAPSALLQLTRDPEFTVGFLDRHQDKLMFGSDCSCTDGKGTPPQSAPQTATRPTLTETEEIAFDAEMARAMQAAMAKLGGLAGKCIARELLTVAWESTTRDVFRKVASENAIRVYGL
ncbi:amidohydrolase family protein [Microbacterium mangrovi]|uniref:amidohydrolase family protein n=1 Tax=Microbacterium mangrovi TaxID=1348253 RepID=UPI00068AB46A|nr:amidohydrolase family protein [Microbacterium mangrovi]